MAGRSRWPLVASRGWSATAATLRLVVGCTLPPDEIEAIEKGAPGNPLFTAPEFVAQAKRDAFPPGTTLRSVLDATGGGGDR